MINRLGLIRWIRYLFFYVMIFFTVLGWINNNYTLIFMGIICLWTNNIIYCFENKTERSVLFLFHITFFIFLLAKPLISIISMRKTWYIVEKSGEGIDFALISIFTSLLIMFLGICIYKNRKKKGLKESRNIRFGKNSADEYFFREKWIEILQNVSLIIFITTLFFGAMVSYEKLMFMQGRSYLEYYTSYQSSLPAMVYRIAGMSKYALCTFLATFPSKKKSFTPLCLYVLSALPDLYIGLRNPFVLNCMFVLVYYIIRESLNDKEKWLGKFEKICLIVSIPLLIVLMGVYSDIRIGRTVDIDNIGKAFLKFFNEQGVSFDVLLIGFRAIPKLPNRIIRNYTFGGIIDYFIYGTIGQNLFGTVALPDGNNLINALQSNSFAHNMSYVALGEEYLAGRGWGTSYLLEVYTDFGYSGIIIFSILLGIFMVNINKLMKKNVFVRTITLLVLTDIFFMPRGEATASIEFFFNVKFWLFIIFTYFVTSIFLKQYYRRKKKNV